MTKKAASKQSGAGSTKVITKLIVALKDAVERGYVEGHGAQGDYLELGRCLNELVNKHRAYRKTQAELVTKAQKMLTMFQKATPPK